jgi:hypothetical protein
MNIKKIIENHKNIKEVGSDSYSTVYSVLENDSFEVARLRLTGKEISIKFNDNAYISHLEKVLTAILEGGEE